MILKSLQLKNFKQYEELNFEFKEGLVGIVGKNGAGKSSIFEAILLCLYGSTSDNGKAFYKSSWAADKDNVFLELHFEVNSKAYKARREFRGKQQANYSHLYDNQENLIATGSKEVSNEVSKMLGLDKRAFTRSIFSGQKELSDISNAKREDRLKLVRRMVGLEKLDRIQQMIRYDRTAIRNKIEGQEATLISEEALKHLEIKQLENTELLKASQKKILELQTEFKSKEQAYLQSKNVFDQQHQLYQRFNDLNNNVIKYNSRIQSLKDDLKKGKVKKEGLIKIQADLKIMHPRIKEYLKHCELRTALDKEKNQFDQKRLLEEKGKVLREQINSFQKEITGLEIELEKGKDWDQQLKSTIKTIEEKQRLIDSLDKKSEGLIEKVGNIEGKIEDRRNKIKDIEAIGKDANCPTCHQPLVKAYEEVLVIIKKEIGDYEQKELKTLRKQLGDIEAKIANEKSSLKTLDNHDNDLRRLVATKVEKGKLLERTKNEFYQAQKAMEQLKSDYKAFSNLTFDPKVYQELVEKITQFEPEYTRFKVAESEANKLPELEEELKSIKTRITKGDSFVKDLNQKITALNFSRTVYNEIVEKRNNQEKTKEMAFQNLNSEDRKAQQYEISIKEIKKELEQNQRILKTIESNRNDFIELDELDGIFKHFKTHILEQVRPIISEYASHLFQRITRGKYEAIDVDDNFEFHIHENGIKYPISRFSGGEIDLANLCLRIGISKAIAELTGSEEGLSFLGFDEIFGSQDEERRHEILLAFDLLKEQYRQIYIISHIDSVKEHFPNIIEVHKEGNGQSVLNWLN